MNLITDKEVVKELIQNDFTAKKLASELHRILDDDTRKRMFPDYYDLEKKLGGSGTSAVAAGLIYENIKLQKL